jgi:hypothetical protein
MDLLRICHSVYLPVVNYALGTRPDPLRKVLADTPYLERFAEASTSCESRMR